MTNTSADPVPAITEADATGDIAALYADIRATLGVPVVNLIWRHLAVFPDGLPWAWESLKPLYTSGAIAAEAAALSAGLEVPVLPGLSGPALAAAGVKIKKHRGCVVDAKGEALLVEFASVVDAVNSASKFVVSMMRRVV